MPSLADDSALLAAAKAEGTLTWYSAQVDAEMPEEVGPHLHQIPCRREYRRHPHHRSGRLSTPDDGHQEPHAQPRRLQHHRPLPLSHSQGAWRSRRVATAHPAFSGGTGTWGVGAGAPNNVYASIDKDTPLGVVHPTDGLVLCTTPSGIPSHAPQRRAPVSRVDAKSRIRWPARP
jgi:hypothetical protein